ncbi:MAG: TolC family protein [Flavobacteriaceae bacterium]|nr:TolC family protein [Flavobacteriaceae bacterium]
MRTKMIMLMVLFVGFSTMAQSKKWTLEQCVAQALENNIQLKKGALSLALQKEEIGIAKANFLPIVNGTASHSYEFGSFIGQSGTRISADSQRNSFRINTSITVYNGNRNKLSLEQSKRNLEVGGLDLETQKDDISLLVVNYFLNVLFNKENIKVANEQLVISQKQLSNMSMLIEAGTRPKSDLFESEASLANDEEKLVTATNNLSLSLLSLSQLLQVSHVGFDTEDVAIQLSNASLIEGDTEAIYQKATGIRTEIESAILKVENTNTDIAIAKTGFLPTVSVGGAVGTSYQHSLGEKDVRLVRDPISGETSLIPNGFGIQLDNNLGYNIGVNVNVPIFNGFRNKINVSKAKIRKEIALCNLEDEKIKLREKIERAYVDSKAALKQYEVSLKSLKSQEVSFKNAQESYSLGVMTSFDFDQVRNRMVVAKSNLINAKYNYIFKSKLLDYYNGIPIVIE